MTRRGSVLTHRFNRRGEVVRDNRRDDTVRHSSPARLAYQRANSRNAQARAAVARIAGRPGLSVARIAGRP